MKVTNLDPETVRLPSLEGGVVVDAPHGKIRIRKWPRKRGTPKSAAVRAQNDWFREAARIMKLAPPTQHVTAIEVTRKTGMYPRDLLMRSISGGSLDLAMPDGRLITPRRQKVVTVSFQGSRVERSSDLATAGGASVAVPWQTPVLDTADMWDVADPTWLTIPPGVNVAEFSAGLTGVASVAGQLVLTIQREDGVSVAQQDTQTDGGDFVNATSGPIPVVEGERFRVFSFSSNARTLTAQPSTFFSATISS